MFKAKKKKLVKPVDEDFEEEESEEEEEVEEEEEEDEVPTPSQLPKSKVQPTQDRITKQEVVDIIEGNLNRSLQLLQYLRQ